MTIVLIKQHCVFKCGPFIFRSSSVKLIILKNILSNSCEHVFAGEGAKPNDIEKGDKKDDRPPTDEIIPVYRRDCHEEVYCGSHAYPGQGVYLLKFDNSYSLWRSKTLYYRVYYSR